MGTQRFTLRELQPSDSPALIKLITEFDDDLTTHFLVDPYQAIVSGTEDRTRGVVVESPGYDGLVGTGTVRFSTVQFNGEVLPLAFLDGLKVQKEFRGKGLGYQIASWRIQKAREEYGDQCVIGTGMLHDNHASHAVARKWCREFAESAVDVRFVPALRSVKLLRRNMRNLRTNRIRFIASTIFTRRAARIPSSTRLAFRWRGKSPIATLPL